MGEVTADMNEEVIQADSSFAPLTEPVLMVMSPPPPFLPTPGVPAMLWPQWIEAFEKYMKALETELVESSKCRLLQNCLGPEGERVFTTLIGEDTKYTAAVTTLTAYFTSDSATQVNRLMFHQRAQMPEETIQEFALALAELVKPCKYESLEKKVILSQLISKMSSSQLRNRLLLLQGKESLTLEEALLIGKEVDSKVMQSQLFDIPEVSVDIGDDQGPPVEGPVKRRRGRPRRGEERKKESLPLKRAPIRSMRRKDYYYYHSDRQYHSDEEAAGNIQLAADYKDGASSALLKVKEEECLNVGDGAGNDVDENNDDFSPSSMPQKGHCCPLCEGKHFRDANKLARHMRMHTKEKPYRCPLCADTFSQSYHMTRHLRSQHGAGQHVCCTCGVSFETSIKLLSHKTTHESPALSCEQCHVTFSDSEALSRHVMFHGQTQSTQSVGLNNMLDDGTVVKSERVADVDNEAKEEEADDDDDAENESKSKSVDKIKSKGNGSPTSEKGHSCPICEDRHFRGPNKLARHMRTHTKEKPFTCPICALTFSQSYHMARHARNKHGIGQYICSKCGNCFASWLEFKGHKRSHLVEELTCFACDKQFKEKSELASHLKVHKKVDSSPRTLVCVDCNKVFTRLYHLKRHIVTHHKESVSKCYTCPDCQKTFAFPEDLNRHLEVHLKENKGICPKCNKDCGSMKALAVHMEVHQKTYSCSICEKKFKVEYALKKHEQSHQNEQFYCSLCLKHFLKLSHYKRHMMVHSRRETRCPHCDTVFLKLTALKYHLRTHTEERPYQCSCCIETFEEKEELEQHCLKHRKFKKERPYSCTRCDNAFSSLVELTEHMASHEGEEPATCPVCARSFLNKNKLEKHLTLHTGERPHLCSICGNGFPSAASLKLHANIHTGERPFQCSHCDKRFRSASSLRLHSRQHMEAPPSYQCPQCGRTYGRMTELKMHQRYHTGDKPYACTCCIKRFISRDKLNVHMRIHTGERPYACPHCGQTFTQTGDRNRHISKHHQLA